MKSLSESKYYRYMSGFERHLENPADSFWKWENELQRRHWFYIETLSLFIEKSCGELGKYLICYGDGYSWFCKVTFSTKDMWNVNLPLRSIIMNAYNDYFQVTGNYDLTFDSLSKEELEVIWGSSIGYDTNGSKVDGRFLVKQ